MTKEEKRIARHEKRSKFLTRMVDEFKKVMVLYSTVFVTGFLIWEHIIYSKGVTPVFPSAIPVALITGFFGTIVAYCFAAMKEKDSLNKNGLVKGADGVIKKAATFVSGTISNVTGSSTTEETEDSEDSDEIPISSCENKK